MNRYKKIQIAIKEILELQCENNETFFAHTVPQKLSNLKALMHFSMVKNEDFNRYISLFQSDIMIDMKRSLAINNNTNAIERAALLESIKKHSAQRLKVVEFACAYFLKDKAVLFRDEDEKPKAINAHGKSFSFYDWIFHNGKHSPASNQAAAS